MLQQEKKPDRNGVFSFSFLSVFFHPQSTRQVFLENI